MRDGVGLRVEELAPLQAERVAPVGARHVVPLGRGDPDVVLRVAGVARVVRAASNGHTRHTWPTSVNHGHGVCKSCSPRATLVGRVEADIPK